VPSRIERRAESRRAASRVLNGLDGCLRHDTRLPDSAGDGLAARRKARDIKAMPAVLALSGQGRNRHVSRENMS
jgi:hypothetical protein